jgi:hypothetical protein
MGEITAGYIVVVPGDFSDPIRTYTVRAQNDAAGLQAFVDNPQNTARRSRTDPRLAGLENRLLGYVFPVGITP